tara:strand:+ start:191 stop:412 length:222 start_codon:yes stop_codon:yes gene_type:complete
MCNERVIDIGDLVEVKRQFFHMGIFNFSSEYDLGIVLEKSPKNYSEDYLVLLVNYKNKNNHITYRRLNEVKKL